MKKILAFIVKTFQGALSFFKSKAKIAVDAVNIIKQFVNDPALDILVNLTSTQWDNAALLALRELLPKIAKNLSIADVILAAGDNYQDVLTELIDYLRGQNQEIRGDFYMLIAGKLTAALSDGHISTGEATAISQAIFKQLQEQN